ncbi:helix-turn-helix domain-containing protein [Undibacterium sp. Di26W]|uniref:helix-turn-helix domain-containing protein n=1 Tax=Undibacterium sp. Di26W TaxID=3413035 RepID=UPI003BF30123
MKMETNWATLELLPASPYSVSGLSSCPSLGLAFARQTGVHAIGSDVRQDFDAWPGELALGMAGLPLFSESAHGGEYLLMHITMPALLTAMPTRLPRQIFHGDKQAVMLAWQLRRLLIQANPDPLLLQEKAGLFLQRGLDLSNLANLANLANMHNTAGSAYATDRALHGRILDYIEDQLDTQIHLDELASLAHMPLLRFLRSFTHATGSTPHTYITERRLQRARRLLRNSNLSIANIAMDCGFAHQSHLGSHFQSSLGVSPQQYRKSALM